MRAAAGAKRGGVLSRFDLRGRVAVITGGAGLLGVRHAAALAEAGARPVLADLEGRRAANEAARIARRFGVAALGVGTDITNPGEVARLVQAVLRRFKRIDILVNNAALTVRGGSADSARYFAPFEDYPLDLWQRALDVNLTGTFLVTQAVGRVMARRRRGVILNIASDVGNISPDHRIYRGVVNPHTKRPFNTPIAYATTKAALINFTRYLATYWAESGIRVNCLSPGGVYQEHDAKFVDNVASRIPLGRMAKADEYQATVLYLVSDASSYMTGANVIVDGGRTAW